MPAPLPALDLAIFPGLIQHLPDHRVLYCKPCTTIVLPKSLDCHLRRYHRCPIAQRRALLEYCSSSFDLLPGLPAELPDGQLQLPQLPVLEGFSCCCCRFLTISRSCIRQHANKVHQLALQACTDAYRRVLLQTWSPGPRAKYWVVAGEAETAEEEGRKKTKRARQSADEQALQELGLQEIRRLEQIEQDCQAQEASLEDWETSPWLRWTNWPAQFAGLPLDVIAASAVQPEKRLRFPADRVLGTWAGEALVSPAANERRLQKLVRRLDYMLDRCYPTVEATPRILRCWVHTNTIDSYWKKPFQLPAKPETYRRYRALWKQFLCFVFRVWATDLSIHKQLYSQLQFSEPQEALLTQVWALLGSGAGSDTKSEVGSDTRSESGLDTRSEFGSDARSELGSDIDQGSDTRSESRSDTWSESGSQSALAS